LEFKRRITARQEGHSKCLKLSGLQRTTGSETQLLTGKSFKHFESALEAHQKSMMKLIGVYVNVEPPINHSLPELGDRRSRY
jgi:hypothetical protein